jgi:hypothetical protein
MKKLLITGVAVLFLATGDTAAAKVDRACARGEIAKMFGRKQAKRICNPANYVKPPRLGWGCEQSSGPLTKVPGGAKRKRDAICE